MRAWVKTRTQEGDTLAKIATRYGVGVPEILERNGVASAATQSASYTARRARALGLHPSAPLGKQRKVVQEDDISVFVNDASGRAVELQPGASKDIERFATCPTGAYAVFTADSVIYLPEWTVKEPDAGELERASRARAPEGKIGGPMTSIAQALQARAARGAQVGNYVLGSVPANATIYDTTKEAHVFEIQTILNDVHGASQVSFRKGPGPAKGLALDGVYGPNTTEAVRMFQVANGITPAHGQMDPQTSRKLQDDEARSVTASPQVPVKPRGGSGDMAMIVGGLGLAAALGGGLWWWSKKPKRNPRRSRRSRRSRR